MEKLNYVLRVSVLLLVFVLVGFAGCGTTPQAGLSAQAGGGQSGGAEVSGSGGGGTEDGGAAQLAADLGKAVKGDTVTLSGWAGIKTALTVPEGVTLDLTAEGAGLELRDGAVLTVNGTVNATGYVYEGDEGSLRFNGAATINGNGTICLKSKGELLYIGKDKKLTLDGVTLAGLEDNDDSLVLVDEGGELVMKSGAITANTRSGEGWAAGGGVQVGKNGTFTMEGGAITDNTVKGKWAYGGGVYVEGAFTMNSGKIAGNIADGNSSAAGGGVRVESVEGVESATFVLAGGEISGNNVTNKNDTGGGGGVFVECAIFIMKGGAISGNSNTSIYSDGGGVTVIGGETEKNAAFIMEGGVISGNFANGAKWSSAGGADVRYAAFTMNGGRIQGGTDSDGFTKNIGSSEGTAALFLYDTTAKWGTGGAYTKGGKPQTGGSDIGSTDDTLIAVPGK
jgi:hypothetical protein